MASPPVPASQPPPPSPPPPPPLPARVPPGMERDGALRPCLLTVGTAAVLVGLSTLSLGKMFATYVFGVLAVAGVVLPDWDFFDRGFSEWFTPMPLDKDRPSSARAAGLERFRAYPLRVALFITIYTYGLYKWWNYVSS